MYYNTQIEDFEIPAFIYTDHLFTKDEISQIEQYCDKLPLTDGKIFTSGIGSMPYRDCSIAYGNYNNEENKWLFDLLSSAVDDVNMHFYNFHLTGFNFFQYAVYQGTGHHYDFHYDARFAEPQMNPTSYGARKLSFSLVLSDNNEYEGGEFEVVTSTVPNSIVPQSKGMLIAFPSFISHRVKPVTSGVRKSIVFWICGPRFK